MAKNACKKKKKRVENAKRAFGKCKRASQTHILFRILKKNTKLEWIEDCQKAFEKIKDYLLNPPILVPPKLGVSLILYLVVQEMSMGCMLGQQDESATREKAIYYVSKRFTSCEGNYS